MKRVKVLFKVNVIKITVTLKLSKESNITHLSTKLCVQYEIGAYMKKKKFKFTKTKKKKK